jgi:hypothetical protein
MYDSREHEREDRMGRFIEGADRTQATLLPETIDDYIGEDNAVRVVDAFVDARDLGTLGFGGVVPEETGRPSYHLATILKISILALPASSHFFLYFAGFPNFQSARDSVISTGTQARRIKW